MGCYGFERPTTPAIDAFASDPDSVVFRTYYVHGAWTKPSTASLFTGLYVHQHGVLTGHDPTGNPAGNEPRTYTTQILADSHETIAERMQAAGYFTVGVVKSRHLVSKYGFAQGFDEYRGPGQAPGGDPGRVEALLDLAERSGRKPFFGYLHLNACHHPFKPRERDRDYMSMFSFDYDEEARQRVGVDFTTAEIGDAIGSGSLDLEPDDVRFLNLVYEAQLRSVDRRLVAPLLEGLRKRNMYENTLLLLTADHGEELYDHQGYDHGHAVWEELVHVPLIVKFPNGRRPEQLGREVSGLTRSVDFIPAILNFIGAPVRDDLPGTPFLRGVFGDESISQTRNEWALVSGEYKLIARSDEPPRLYHLSSDPTEQHDIAAEEPDLVERLQSRLEDLLLAGATEAPRIDDRLTPEAEANLRALGYLR